MGESLLTVEGVGAGYGDLTIVHGVDLFVGRGERVLIFGPNGSGKSTLLKAISGLVPPSAGSVRLEGTELAGRPTHRIVRAGLSYVPQNENVFADLTVEENLEVGAATARSHFRRRRDEVFDLFGKLAERRRQQAGSLSGGERQLVAMARALMLEPSVLMLDEPSAGLSPAMVDQTFEHVRTVNEDGGVAILLVEQNVLKGMEVAHRGYLLETGRVKLSASAAELRESEVVRQAYLGAGPGAGNGA
ncbi:MAG: ABC transporter ATP-binding protein [Actinomycetota bacterium]|jgi:neutral amino acid transport system ATP-binding protein|nr:ABC transporter ATP-binding protein [Actinomycetota bacterium]